MRLTGQKTSIPVPAKKNHKGIFCQTSSTTKQSGTATRVRESRPWHLLLEDNRNAAPKEHHQRKQGHSQVPKGGGDAEFRCSVPRREGAPSLQTRDFRERIGVTGIPPYTQEEGKHVSRAKALAPQARKGRQARNQALVRIRKGLIGGQGLAPYRYLARWTPRASASLGGTALPTCVYWGTSSLLRIPPLVLFPKKWK